MGRTESIFRRGPRRLAGVGVAALGAWLVAAGCAGPDRNRPPTPTDVGLNTRDVIDLSAQSEADRVADLHRFVRAARRTRELARVDPPPPRRTILSLSGGGAYGAYTAGVLCGWTARGDRPDFDVVTGISTGALAAPYAFLGPKYDARLKQFFTELESRDLYRKTPVKGLFGESFADSTPLVRHLDEAVTPDLMAEIAAEHAKGRRLYIGTTEAEGRRFVVWDVGAIACRGTPDDLHLIRLILQGSSAIPGFFPSAKIPVTIDGRRLVERHIDGGTSMSLFVRPPYVPPDKLDDPAAHSLYGSDVYAIVAGKLYADPDPEKPRALSIAGASVSTVIYAQTRGDLTRLWTVCQLAGMNYHMAAIPDAYPAPKSSTEFKRAELLGMFDEGVRQVTAGTAWRSTPPGVAPGEAPLVRSGTDLTHVPPGTILVPGSGGLGWPGEKGIPVPPPGVVK
jgi:predicted acylesterase/phospholipase RssA